MLPFHPGADLVEARARLRGAVERALEAVASGEDVPAAEREAVDFKEEAGRRGSGGVLLEGQPQNLAAADALAKEVTCLANTPGGGALVVGVEDSTGALLGTELDAEWLRQRIYQRVDVAPAVEQVDVAGTRLLVLYVASAREPVEDQDGKLRWRTGGACEPVDRAEWWLHRQDATGSDPMATVTDRTALDVPAGAIAVARRYLRQEAAAAYWRRRTSARNGRGSQCPLHRRACVAERVASAPYGRCLMTTPPPSCEVRAGAALPSGGPSC